MKIASFVAAATLMAALGTPAKAQVDMRTGLHIDDPAHYSKDHRRYSPMPQLASAQAVSPTGHDRAAAW